MDRSARLPGRSPTPALPAPRPRGGGGPRPRDSLRPAVGAPRCAPGLHEELEPPARSLSAPRDAATWGRERRAGIRGGCGAPERVRNFGVTSHNRLLPRGRRHTATTSPSSLAPPQPLLPLVSPFTYARDPHPRDPILARSSPHCRAARDF
ncbi:hypothetical protein ACRRTK_024267 [Alexandromys fortis]